MSRLAFLQTAGHQSPATWTHASHHRCSPHSVVSPLGRAWGEPWEHSEQSGLTASAVRIKAEEREAGCDHSLRSPQQTRPSSVAWDQGLAGFGAIRKNHQSILDRQSVLVSGSSGPETKGSGPGSQRGVAERRESRGRTAPARAGVAGPAQWRAREEAGGRQGGGSCAGRRYNAATWRPSRELPLKASLRSPLCADLPRELTHHRLKLQALSKNPARRGCWRSVLCARRSASFPERRAPRFPALRKGPLRGA